MANTPETTPTPAETPSKDSQKKVDKSLSSSLGIYGNDKLQEINDLAWIDKNMPEIPKLD